MTGIEGVACYIRNDIAFNIRVVYSPSRSTDFLDHFTGAKSNTHTFDEQEVYILGDFNIDINTNSNLTKTYKEICSLHRLKQLIDSSTR